MTVHVFQIGCQDIGRLGLENFLELEEYSPADVSLEGVYCRDFEVEEEAETFAKSLDKDLKVFKSVDDLYSGAKEVEGDVLVYDAGVPQLRSQHIERSLRNGFHHLTERPPSMTRSEHLGERSLAADSSVTYKVDFIERENPVVRKVKELTDGLDIEKVEVFRESSFGVQKVLNPVDFAHVKGGCVLDKMSNEIYVLDFLEGGFSFEGARIDYIMPGNLGGEKVLKIDGSSGKELDEESAVGKCHASFSCGDSAVELNASWLGLSKEARMWDKEINERFGENILSEEHVESQDKSFRSEECRFFVLKGEKDFLADLMNEKLYDLGEGEEVDVPVYPRSQLYRVLEKAVLDAAGVRSYQIDEEEVTEFMNGLFDVQECVDGEVFEEIDRASERIRSLIVSDKKFSDQNEAEGVAR